MRFLHTADWHLGRSLHGVALIEDQAQALRQVIDLAKESKPDVILIAGDIYDRAIPSTEAVELLDNTLSRLILDLEVPVVLIAGNHDSPQRLQFASRLVASLQLHVFGTLPDVKHTLQMYAADGPFEIMALPYIEPAVARQQWQAERVTTHDAVAAAWVERLRSRRREPVRTLAVHHAFVAGGLTSDSERPLAVGGSEAVSAAHFAAFSYVALGHLHRPQTLAPNLHYSGSLLKYSFSEVDHAKSVNLVEMTPAGECTVTPVPLTPRRDVRIVEGYLRDLLTAPALGGRDDLLRVQLLDEGALLDVMHRLREVYPNVLEIQRTRLNRPALAGPAGDRRGRDPNALFADFFEQVTGEALNPAQAAAFSETVHQVSQAEAGA